MLRRYLTAVGVILAVIVAVGLWLKPSPAEMREQVETGLAQYALARAQKGEPLEETVLRESADWVIGRSYRAVVGDQAFFCIGGYNITFCSIPD